MKFLRMLIVFSLMVNQLLPAYAESHKRRRNCFELSSPLKCWDSKEEEDTFRQMGIILSEQHIEVERPGFFLRKFFQGKLDILPKFISVNGTPMLTWMEAQRVEFGALFAEARAKREEKGGKNGKPPRSRQHKLLLAAIAITSFALAFGVGTARITELEWAKITAAVGGAGLGVSSIIAVSKGVSIGAVLATAGISLVASVLLGIVATFVISIFIVKALFSW